MQRLNVGCLLPPGFPCPSDAISAHHSIYEIIFYVAIGEHIFHIYFVLMCKITTGFKLFP